jgi:hypothetical protein
LSSMPELATAVVGLSYRGVPLLAELRHRPMSDF